MKFETGAILNSSGRIPEGLEKKIFVAAVDSLVKNKLPLITINFSSDDNESHARRIGVQGGEAYVDSVYIRTRGNDLLGGREAQFDRMSGFYK